MVEGAQSFSLSLTWTDRFFRCLTASSGLSHRPDMSFLEEGDIAE